MLQNFYAIDDFVSRLLKIVAFHKILCYQENLCELAGISSTSVAKLGRGDNVNTEVLCKICGALNCNVDDIMEFVRDTETTNTSSNSG